MDAPDTLNAIRDRLESTPHPILPSLRPRKPVDLPGTSTFSVADQSNAETPLPFFRSHQTPLNVASTPSYASGAHFRPFHTPDSLPRARNPSKSLAPSFSTASSSRGAQMDPFDHFILPGLDKEHPQSDLDGLSSDSDTHPFRSRRTTNAYTKIHNLLAELRRDRISPIDLLIQVLDYEDAEYDRYRGNLYRDESSKLALLLEKTKEDPRGKQKLLGCMRTQLVEFACDTVADEMKVRRSSSLLSGILRHSSRSGNWMEKSTQHLF
ncbi:hypothetical protein DFH09DRAFT_1096439 [Mycena vulgaris]|nr:hypothetical protein DFH09DRAFT_1096439 [Mycena vulgaris]